MYKRQTETNVVDSQTASAQTDDKDTENVEDAETSKVLEPDDTKSNFHYNLWEVPKGGAKTRYQWNVDAINTLKKIEAEGRLATSEEQKILANYVGWGGLSQAFDDNNASWKKEYDELKTLLSEEEYTAARATVNNAFYTAPEVASCISQALVQFGFRGGNVLEPSMGIGNFFGTLPTPLQRSNLYGVEPVSYTHLDVYKRQYQMELLGTGKKKKGKAGKKQEVTETRTDAQKAKNQEEFEAMKKKTKRLLFASIGVMVAAVAGIMAYKYMQ